MTTEELRELTGFCGWIIYDADADPLSGTLTPTIHGSIVMAEYNTQRNWEDLKKVGYKVVKVTFGIEQSDIRVREMYVPVHNTKGKMKKVSIRQLRRSK